MNDDPALRQACEELADWFYRFHPNDTDSVNRLLAFAKAQRREGYDAAAQVIEDCQVPIGTDAAQDYRSDKQHNLALILLARKIHEQRDNDLEGVWPARRSI